MRLTKKDSKGNYSPIDIDCYCYSAEIYKLGQLEDMRDELDNLD